MHLTRIQTLGNYNRCQQNIMVIGRFELAIDLTTVYQHFLLERNITYQPCHLDTQPEYHLQAAQKLALK